MRQVSRRRWPRRRTLVGDDGRRQGPHRQRPRFNLTGLLRGYTTPADGCTTYAVCMAELARFELDLHRHVHLEDNVLFSKALELEEGGCGTRAELTDLSPRDAWRRQVSNARTSGTSTSAAHQAPESSGHSSCDVPSQRSRVGVDTCIWCCPVPGRKFDSSRSRSAVGGFPSARCPRRDRSCSSPATARCCFGWTARSLSGKI
jgi:hypothetical protein